MPARMLEKRPRRNDSRRGYALIEVLVYIGIVMLLLGIGYSALYRCIDNSVALRRSVDDVAGALRLGERWRADVRAASGEIRLETEPGKQTLYLPCARGQTAYQFSGGALFRRFGDGPWIRSMANVKASSMEADRRRNVVVWRWELELQPQSKASVKGPRMRPLFTFLAVPEKGPSAASAQSSSAVSFGSEFANGGAVVRSENR